MKIDKELSDIQDFIIGVDNQDKIMVVPITEFTRVFTPLTDYEQVTILMKFHRLVQTGKISFVNHEHEWNGINFSKFIETQLETIEKTLILEDKMSIYKSIDTIVNSELPVIERITKLMVYKESFSGPWIDGQDFTPKDVFNYIMSKLELLEALLRQEQYSSSIDPPTNNRYKSHATFADYLVSADPLRLISKLKEIFPTGRNKEAAVMIIALIENGKIEMPTNKIDVKRAIEEEWKTTFKDQGFNTRFLEISRSKKTGYKGEVVDAIKKVKQICCF